MALGLLIAAALLVASGWVLWHVLRQQGRLLLRLEALEADQPASSPAPQPASTGTTPGALTGQFLHTSAPASLASLSTFPVAVVDRAPPPTEADEELELTIGMATYNDFDGVYFTLQALRLYQDLEHVELLVID